MGEVIATMLRQKIFNELPPKISGSLLRPIVEIGEEIMFSLGQEVWSELGMEVCDETMLFYRSS